MLSKVKVASITSNTQAEKTKIKLMASGEFTKVKSIIFNDSIDVERLEEDIIVINILDLYPSRSFHEWLIKLAQQVKDIWADKQIFIYDPASIIVMQPNPQRLILTEAFYVTSDIKFIQQAIQTVVVKSLF